MLSNTINLSYIDAGETVANDHGFTKDSHPINSKGQAFANFVSDEWTSDPSTPQEWVTMTPQQPKKTKEFFGVRRGHVAYYREVSVPTPSGSTIVAVANMHLNTSFPDGMSGELIEECMRAFCALIPLQAVLDHVKSSQV